MIEAVNHNHVDTVKLLLERKPNLDDIRNEDRWSALMFAIYRQNFELVQMLIEAGADINIYDRIDSTSLIMAIRQDNEQIFRYLLEKGAKVTPIFQAAPLIEAVGPGRDLFVKLLLEAGADVNQRRWSFQRRHHETALDIAIEKRLPSIIQLLKEYGATD